MRSLSETVIITFGPSPPPPPLGDVKADWTPLYFLLGLIGTYLVVILAVIISLTYFRGTEGERKPLYYPTVDPAKQEARRKWGKPAWVDVSPEEAATRAVDGWVRAAFVRKVYALLSTQLLLTVGIVVGLIYASFVQGDHLYPSSFGNYIVGPGYYLSLMSILAGFCVLCCLMSVKDRYPINLAGLALFTSLISFTVGIICVIYYGSGLGKDITLAFVITTVRSCQAATLGSWWP